MPEYYDVVPYTIESLKQILAEKSGAKPSVVESKLHSYYFKNYFDKIDAKTIVIEENYVDRDFLEDFSGYYVRCFTPYKRFCTRLHFFSNEFSDEDFALILQGTPERIRVEDLTKKGTYLGFIVVKPLPQKVIGRTCLATYPSNNGQRNFPCLRKYTASLFGIPLSIMTLAFQEQDSVVAACATSALWTVFHGTGMLFQHSIPSPVEITRTAVEAWGNGPTFVTRTFPNQGLTMSQMAYAIKSIGLEPYLVSAKSSLVLKSHLYAYLRGRIPLLLGLDLIDYSSEPPTNNGKHAVAITGYRFEEPAESEAVTVTCLRALEIDRIYVHDDQVGPFARMLFDSPESPDSGSSFTMSTSWPGQNGEIGSIRAVPDLLLIPIYPKIRIPFEEVLHTILRFDFFIEVLRTAQILSLDQRLQWDIYLTTVNDLKQSLFESNSLTGEKKKQYLVADLPHYIWRSTACCGHIPVFDILVDATDIAQGNYVCCILEYDSDVSDAVKTVCATVDFASLKIDNKVINWFRQRDL